MEKTTKRPRRNFGLMQREIIKHVKGNDFRVYASLLTYADKFGKCFPSVETIAGDTGITARNVQKHLANLDAEGWIDKNFRTNTSTMYQLYFADTSKTPAMKSKRNLLGASNTDRAGASKFDRSGASKTDIPGVSKLDVLTDQLTDHTTNHNNNTVIVPVVKSSVASDDDAYKLTPDERTKFKELWNKHSQDGEAKFSALSAWAKYCSMKDPILLIRIKNHLEPETGTYMTNQMKQIAEEYFDGVEKKKQLVKLKAEGKIKSL